MISAGRLRWNARVMKAATTTDSLGRRTSTFTGGLYFRTDMRERGAAEVAYADGVAVTTQYELRTRWPEVARTTMTELDRIVVRGKTLRIESIENADERDRLAVIQCTEVV